MEKIKIMVLYMVATVLSLILPKRLPTYHGEEFIGWSYEYPRWKIWLVFGISFCSLTA